MANSSRESGSAPEREAPKGEQREGQERSLAEQARDLANEPGPGKDPRADTARIVEDSRSLISSRPDAGPLVSELAGDINAGAEDMRDEVSGAEGEVAIKLAERF